MPVLKKGGFWINRFSVILRWGGLIFILVGFFDIGVLSPQIKWTMPIRIAGALVCMSGIFIQCWSVKSLGQNYSPQVLLRKGQLLITDGSYRYIRHPYYLGEYLIFFGFSLTLLSYLTFGVTIFIYWPYLTYRARIEEYLLLKLFGKEYKHYQEQVGKFFPKFY